MTKNHSIVKKGLESAFSLPDFAQGTIHPGSRAQAGTGHLKKIMLL